MRYIGSPEASVDKQLKAIRQALSEGANAICISALDPTGLDQALREAMDAGVAVTTWDSDVSPDSRTLMVSQGTPDVLGKMLVDMGIKSLINRGVNVNREPVRYAWHYSQSAVADQNSWQIEGEKYIRAKYPNWINVHPDNYYSMQDPMRSIEVGEEILRKHPDIQLIICNDSTALPGQCQAAQNLGYDQNTLTITGFAAPDSIKDYCRRGIIERWGLWDCRVQGALGCYLAYLLATGEDVRVGDMVSVPDIGDLGILPNSVLDPEAITSPQSGVVLLPERLEFTRENMMKYNF